MLHLQEIVCIIFLTDSSALVVSEFRRHKNDTGDWQRPGKAPSERCGSGHGQVEVMSGQGWGVEFYDCVFNNDLQRLESLVEQHRIDLDAKFTCVRRKNHVDLSPIHLVAYNGYTGMLQVRSQQLVVGFHWNYLYS